MTLPAESSVRPPQQRPAPRGKLGNLEGLHQIVVRAGIKAEHPIIEPAARGQDQDRHRVLPPPEPAHQIKSFAIGQAEIEEHQVIVVDREGMLGPGDGLAPVDRKALTIETLADQARH